MIEFKSYDLGHDYPNTSVRMETDAEGIEEIIDVFERFLQACGYVLGGHVYIAEDVAECDQQDEWEIDHD